MAAGSSSAADGGKATLTGGASSFTTGDGGATEVFAGDSTSQDGGDITVAAGSGGINGGSLLLKSGTGVSGNGGNVYLNPGSNGVSAGTVSFFASSTFFSSNEAVFDVTATGQVTIESYGDLDLISSQSISLSATNGIDLDESFLYGFEIAPEAAVSSLQVTINAQSGSFTIPMHASHTVSSFYTLYNNRVTSDSLFFSQTINSVGSNCDPHIKKAVCHVGYVDIEITEYRGLDCTSDATIAFLVIG
eukprot:scaffold395_cov265-Chaetoceros_neogracile.AAC.46